MIREPRPLKLALRWLVIGYLILLVLWPVSLVVTNTFADGLTNLKTAFTSPAVLSALRLTAKVTIWAWPRMIWLPCTWFAAVRPAC